ncbi:MAG: hypothetical protein AAFY26_17755, partial [Cyanobacteria bacterium J06638_22]
DGRKGSTAAIQAFVAKTGTLTINRGIEILTARGLGSQGRGEMPEGRLPLPSSLLLAPVPGSPIGSV